MATSLGTALLLGLVACSSQESRNETGRQDDNASDQQSTITVFAASSLATAFEEISKAYQSRNPAHKVVLNFDGSQRLRTQLEHGATADVFASADWAQMAALRQKGMLTGNPTNFASNRLVLMVSASGSDIAPDQTEPPQIDLEDVFATELRRLAQPGMKIVLGQPEVPIGRYSEQLMKKLEGDPSLGRELVETIIANVVSREASVRGVAQKVALGEADGGFTYATDASYGYSSQEIRVVELPRSLLIEAMYPVAPLSTGESATKFIDFLLSEQGQKILRRQGFGPPAGNETDNSSIYVNAP